MKRWKILSGSLLLLLLAAMGVIWRQDRLRSNTAETIARLQRENAALRRTPSAPDPASAPPASPPAAASPARAGTDPDVSAQQEAQIIARHLVRRAQAEAEWAERVNASPELQEAYLHQLRTSVPVAYARLYHRLSLSPQQIERFEAVMAQRFTDLSRFRVSTVGQRLSPDERSALFAKAVAATEGEIQSVLGHVGYQEFLRHEERVPVQSLVENLHGKAAAIAAPFSPQQADLVSEALLASSNYSRHGRIPGSGVWVDALVTGATPSSLGAKDINWESALADLRTALDARQLKLLEAVYREELARKDSAEIKNALRSPVPKK